MSPTRETELLLESLRGVWDEEAVDELTHARQAAACAIEDGADDELVLASALHDIGHSPWFGEHGYRHHDATAREWLTERYGPRVGWLAGAHVVAKRFLVSADPDYAAGLTPASVHSLAAQGGAHVDPEYATHPWWPDALRLRRYDDAAKVPGAQGIPVSVILEIADRVLRDREAR